MIRHTYKKIFSLIVFSVILSGCMFPNDELAKNKMPNEDQLLIVQNAVEAYAEETGGLLPIKTKDADTDIYEKLGGM